MWARPWWLRGLPAAKRRGPRGGSRRGPGQLDAKLRSDERVLVLEGATYRLPKT